MKEMVGEDYGVTGSGQVQEQWKSKIIPHPFRNGFGIYHGPEPHNLKPLEFAVTYGVMGTEWLLDLPDNEANLEFVQNYLLGHPDLTAGVDNYFKWLVVLNDPRMKEVLDEYIRLKFEYVYKENENWKQISKNVSVLMTEE